MAFRIIVDNMPLGLFTECLHEEMRVYICNVETGEICVHGKVNEIFNLNLECVDWIVKSVTIFEDLGQNMCMDIWVEC